MRKLSHQEIVDRQVTRMNDVKIPLVMVLNDIRSLNNVGSMFRIADGVGVEKLWLCGITGFPPQSGISKTALGAEDSVSWEYAKDLKEVIKNYKDKGYEIAALEQIEDSVNYWDYTPQKPVCLIVGNEVDGVSEDVLPLCDVALEIHMSGVKNSLNVSVATGIVMYQIKNEILNNKVQETRNK